VPDAPGGQVGPACGDEQGEAMKRGSFLTRFEIVPVRRILVVGVIEVIGPVLFIEIERIIRIIKMVQTVRLRIVV